MLSKEKFLDYMNVFKELRCLEDDLNIVLDKLCYNKEYIGLDRHDTLIIKLIEEVMNDKDRMISTYIYETGNLFDICIPKLLEQLLISYGLVCGSESLQVLNNEVYIYPREYFTH